MMWFSIGRPSLFGRALLDGPVGDPLETREHCRRSWSGRELAQKISKSGHGLSVVLLSTVVAVADAYSPRCLAALGHFPRGAHG
jgi:hypothetical protein